MDQKQILKQADQRIKDKRESGGEEAQVHAGAAQKDRLFQPSGFTEGGQMNMDMDKKELNFLTELMERYPELKSVEESIKAAYFILRQSYLNGGMLLVAGNGGSCGDAEHIVGELMKGFLQKREVPDSFAKELYGVDEAMGRELAQSLQGSLPAIALTGHPGLSTAFLNDVNGEMVYAQQVYGYGRAGDVFLGISTSGNSRNIMYALTTAKARGMKTIGLTGNQGGLLGQRADIAIKVPQKETYKIQELHLPVYHTLCLMLEAYFFG